MSQDDPDVPSAGLAPRQLARPRVISAAHPSDVALEQLEYLLEHSAGGLHVDGCPDCRRLLAARNVLLTVFEP